MAKRGPQLNSLPKASSNCTQFKQIEN